MSHVAKIDMDVKDVDCFARACARVGLEFRPGQKTYRWWGSHQGDYPLPEGFTAEDLGQCEHAAGIPGNLEAYEIGLTARRDGRPGYQLLWDFFAGGYGLQAKIGANCVKLKQAYAAEVALKQARLQGFAAQEQVQADGTIRVRLFK